MKAVCEFNEAERKHYSEMLANLTTKTVGINKEELISYDRATGHAHYSFKGKVLPKFIEVLGTTPLPEEIIATVDGGFYHFGASCSTNIESDGTMTFYGRINTD